MLPYDFAMRHEHANNEVTLSGQAVCNAIQAIAVTPVTIKKLHSQCYWLSVVLAMSHFSADCVNIWRNNTIFFKSASLQIRWIVYYLTDMSCKGGVDETVFPSPLAK